MNMWEKKVHVKGTLPKKDEQYAMFIGRWQPLHEGHKQMFQQVLDKGGRVCIAIRDVKPDEKNPWSSIEVMSNLTNEYIDLIKEDKVKILIIPDICSVEFGRGVGYDVIEHIPPQEIHDISATKIREQMKAEGKL
jgi:nicotinamide mononucleotide adenylyltransferase